MERFYPSEGPARHEVKKNHYHLAAKIDILLSQFAEMRELLSNLQPDRPVPTVHRLLPLPQHDDALSPRAPCTDISDEPRAEQVEEAALDSITISEWSGRESRMGSGSGPGSISP